MQARIWAPLKNIVKIYGMTELGVISGLVGCVITMIFMGVTWSVGGAIPGYFIGDYLAKSLHDGSAQRMIRWYFGSGRRGKCTPDSSVKMFF